MMIVLKWAGSILISVLKTRQKLTLENLVLRQQLAVLNRSGKLQLTLPVSQLLFQSIVPDQKVAPGFTPSSRSTAITLCHNQKA